MSEAKEFFNQLRNIDKQIDVKCEELERLKAFSTRVTSALKEVVVSGSGSGAAPFENAMDKIIQLQNEVNEQIDRFIDMKAEAVHIISALCNEKHRRILTDRYINNKTFEEIAVAMDYSYFGICKLHGAALKAADDVIEKIKLSSADKS